MTRTAKPVAKPPPPKFAAPDNDPGGVWERAIRKLAAEAKVDAMHLIEEWHERAAIRVWDGGASIQEANAAAFEDVRTRLYPQVTIKEAG